MIIREAEEDDLESINNLLFTSFGISIMDKDLDGLWVADSYVSGVVAVSGIKGDRVSWSAVAIDYRGKGVMTRLLKEVLWLQPEGKLISLYAWHLGNSRYANMHKVALRLGFELIKEKININGVCQTCPIKYQGCSCWQDLYQVVTKKPR